METFSALLAFCAGNSPVNSPHKGHWRRALMFLWSAPSINAWVNNREAGDLRHHRAHYDVIVMGLRGLHKWFYCLPYRPNSAPLMAISVFPFPLIRPQAGTCILWCLVLSFLDTDMVQVDGILPHKAYTCFLSPYHDGCWLAVTISHCISSLSIDWNIPVSAPGSFIIEKFLVYVQMYYFYFTHHHWCNSHHIDTLSSGISSMLVEYFIKIFCTFVSG